MATTAQRNKLISIAELLVNHKNQVDYTESSARWSIVDLTWAEAQARIAKGEHLAGDCSSTVTAMCKWAGLKDPNGDDYRGGYTGTLLSHLPHFSSDERAHAGAIGIFGAGTGTHAVMEWAHDKTDPWVFSHGSEIGPLKIRLSDESKSHVGQPFTWLDISGL